MSKLARQTLDTMYIWDYNIGMVKQAQTKENTMTDIARTYNTRREELAAKIEALSEWLNDLPVYAEDNEPTWPMVGDMGYVNKQLGEIIDFIS